jgi:diadenosine tetraphosphate (Ap4A) HIT family hydrolase
MTPCPLCASHGGRLVFNGPSFRVVYVHDPGLPAFYRLIWNTHVAELTDLPPLARGAYLLALTTTEEVLREHLAPHKINLASLGNQVPHLHWHVIARFDWDSHFPDAVWAVSRREVDKLQVAQVKQKLSGMEQTLASRLATLFPENQLSP